MSTQPPDDLQEYLKRKEVQERIQHRIQQARSNVTVTISRAAELFGFSESRLREWEKRGLLTTDRNITEGKEGHRRYTTNELSKLAILHELFNFGGYGPGDVPPDYDEIWEDIEHEQQSNGTAAGRDSVEFPALPYQAPKDTMFIDHRIEHAEQEVFWRYFTSQVLRLSLMLICEDIPDTMAGLVLPLGEKATFVHDPKDLTANGQALIGWLSPNGSFNTFLSAAPHFEHPSDFRIEPLLAHGEDESFSYKTMIIVQRKAKPLNLSLPLVQTLRRLLSQVYANVSQWYSSYGYGLRDYLYQATDFNNVTHPEDTVLNSLMNMVIQLGGPSQENSQNSRWKFCCLLLPQDSSLPVQRRSLIVSAQSTDSPYKLGTSIVSTKVPPGLSLRAYQSGTIIYEPDILLSEAIIAYAEQEKSTRSAIALPIVREDGLPIAALYIASDEDYSFPIESQRVLRLISTMIQELLLTYSARQQAAGKKTDLIDRPEIVDTAFEDFLTENDFIRDLEKILFTIADVKENTFVPDRDVSFIAIDIDDQSTFSMRYGDRVARNISQEVGTRLQEHLKLFAKLNNKVLYHLNADRYYLLLDGMSLDEARKSAEQIRIALKGNYLVDAQRFSSKGTKLPVNMLEIPQLTIRLGVTSYTYDKLKEILLRYPSETSLVEVKTLVMGSLDTTLSTARREGGNKIVSWDPNIWGYTVWTPSQSESNNS